MADLRETLERELKLSTGERFAMPDLGGEAIATRVFVSTYHDTPEHRLARSGLTLRYRVENGRGRWQLKLPRGDARLELEADGSARTADGECFSRVVRGGGWDNNSVNLRSASRGSGRPFTRSNSVGFRVARTLTR